MADWARKLSRILDRYRRDDGTRWTGAAIERATRGTVSKDYFSKLKTGKIARPSFEHLHAISQAIGFPLAEWAREPDHDDPPPGRSTPVRR